MIFLALYLLATPLWAAEETPFACGVKIEAGMPDKFQCLKSSGNNALNAKAVSFARHLNGAFDLHVKSCFIEDTPPNAWAQSDGKVYIGRNLIRKEFEEFGNVALLGVLAHEWVHQYQFQALKEKKLASYGGVQSELQADCVAGYHLARFGHIQDSEMTGFARSLFGKGDYLFNDPNHHGTPDARLLVMRFGFQKGTEQKLTGKEIFPACLAEAESQYKESGKKDLIPAVKAVGTPTVP